jgi:glycine cleavage system H protein
MNNIPTELKYTTTHEWARLETDGNVTVGITEHAQALLGDIVFVELPECDSEVSAGNEAGVVESVKAASDIYAPINGTIIAINEALANAPDLVNTEPYVNGWLFRIQPLNIEELGELLDADSYGQHILAEGH